jgi:hypothetical protein
MSAMNMRSTHSAHTLAAYVLIAGLILEVINAVIWFHGAETIAGIVAVLLIVGGVWGEVHFAHKARLAGDKQLAQYEARTAEANQKAAEAAVELAKFRAPRRSLMTPEALASITEKLRPFAGTQFDSGIGAASGEQADFWWDLQPAIVAAGWVHIPWEYGHPDKPMQGGGIIITQADRPASGSVAVTNVEIHLFPRERDLLLPAATALISALNEVGIDAADAGYNASSATANAIHILIGDKA